MCTKCDTEIKAALDHVIVAALKMARLTQVDYRVSAVEGLLFIILPVLVRDQERVGDPVVVVRANSTASELKDAVAGYMTRLAVGDATRTGRHAPQAVEVVDWSYKARDASADSN